MTTPFFIRSIVFSLVFLAVMSVSFLVEAHDIPDGQVALASPMLETYGPTLPRAVAMDLADIEDGLASWYGPDFHGRRTASGSVFNMHELTAAHRTLPFGSLIKVVNTLTGQSVVVEVTDRGPFVNKRVIDLSKAAAQRIGVSVTKVDLQALTPKAVEDFYNRTSERIIVVTPEMDVQVREASSLHSIAPVRSFAQAMKSAKSTDVVVVLPDGLGGTVYAVASSMPVALAYADTALID